MNRAIDFIDLGMKGYQSTWDYQEELFNATLQNKKEKRETTNTLLFVEHNHVYTLGKSGDEENLLLNYIQLQAKDAEFIPTNRGGDITYHGPGQIVGYPIFDLENFDLGLREYIHKLEEAIILTIAEFGLYGSRDEKASGVWLDVGTPKARKICAIGVKSSRYVTMHGFAFNINTDLSYFNHINPCGFTDRGVTSLEKELGGIQDYQKIKSIVHSKLLAVFR